MSYFRQCSDGINCECGWGNANQDGIETCVDRPENCSFYKSRKQLKSNKKPQLKPWRTYRDERFFGENIREAIQILKRWWNDSI